MRKPICNAQNAEGTSAEGAAVAGDGREALAFAHQKYRSVKYRETSEHGSIVYEKNPRRTDNLILGIIYCQFMTWCSLKLLFSTKSAIKQKNSSDPGFYPKLLLNSQEGAF
ncbi:hypothetical protein ACQJBY_053279 [Aegilops geniculata]